MPIDPNIALNVRPVQVESPIEQYGKMLSLKNLMTQGKMQQQAIKSSQIQNQQAELQMQEDAAFKEAIRSGKTPEEIVAASPSKGLAYQKTILEMQKSRIEHAMSQAKVIGQFLGSAKDQSSWESGLSELKGLGIDIGKVSPIYDPSIVASYQAKGMETKDQLEEAHKKVTEQLTRAGQAETARHNQSVESQSSASQTETSRHNKATEEQALKPKSDVDLSLIANDPNKPEADRTLAKNAMSMLEKHALASRPVTNIYGAADPRIAAVPKTLTGNDYLEELKKKNPQFAARVQAVVDGREPAPSGRAAMQGAGQQLMEAVYGADPEFTTQRAQIRKAFTAGNDGRNIRNLNTAMVHLNRLGSVSEALKNGNFTPKNEFYNWVKDKFGSSAPTNFTLLKDAIAGEMASALKGNATDIEIEKMGKSIRGSNSPGQMFDVVKEGMGILLDKANTYDESYHQQIPGDSWSPILPSARSALQRYGITKESPTSSGPPTGAKIMVTDPDGGQHWFADQAAADKFKKLAGIK